MEVQFLYPTAITVIEMVECGVCGIWHMLGEWCCEETGFEEEEDEEA